MFGSKQQKTTELIEKVELLEKENTDYKERQKEFDYYSHNCLQSIVMFDYSLLVSFEGNVMVSTTVREDEYGVNCCIDLEKNGEVKETFIVFRGKDDGVVSHLVNYSRRNAYELTKSVAKYMVDQITLIRNRMGYKCDISFEDRLPEEGKKYFGYDEY